jgi:hypothetical protein
MNIDIQRNRLKNSIAKNIYDLKYYQEYGVYTLKDCLSSDDICILNDIFEDDTELSPDIESALEIVTKCLNTLSLPVELISVRFENHKSNACMTLIGNETNDTNIFKMVLPLQDVTDDMGPYLFYPNTNNIIMYKQSLEDSNGEIIERNHVLGTVKKGDCIIYQSNILKFMKDNTSGIDNKMLIITYKGKS